MNTFIALTGERITEDTIRKLEVRACIYGWRFDWSDDRSMMTWTGTDGAVTVYKREKTDEATDKA